MEECSGRSRSQKLQGGAPSGPEKFDADVWFSDWERVGVLLEEVRHFPRWDQTLTLLSFEDGEVLPEKRELREDEGGLGSHRVCDVNREAIQQLLASSVGLNSASGATPGN
jgi:hypothetical protein